MSFYKKYYSFTRENREDKIDDIIIGCVIVGTTIFFLIIMIMILLRINWQDINVRDVVIWLFMAILFGYMFCMEWPFKQESIDINSERIIFTNANYLNPFFRKEPYPFKYPFNVDLSPDKTSLYFYYTGYAETVLDLTYLTESEKQTIIDLLKQQKAVRFRQRLMRLPYLTAPQIEQKPIVTP
jgi:hypothetical protein